MSPVKIILLILVLLLVFGGMPVWGHGGLGYGWAPSGIGFILLVILILWLLGIL